MPDAKRVSDLGFLRDHWYPVARLDELVETTPIRLFGEPYLARPANGDTPAAVLAPSGGWASTRTLPSCERYGLLWTCVGQPTTDGPPPWPEAEEPGWRVMVEFFEPWNCSALRIIDNNFDNSHVAYVHRTTFGDPADANLARPDVEPTDGPWFRSVLRSEQRGLGAQNGRTDDETERFERTSTTELIAPLTTRVRMRFGGSLPDYAFYGVATPIDDETSIFVRLTALAGTPEEQPWQAFHAFGTRVKEEDRVILETTIPDFFVDLTSEVHLRCDSATLAYRRSLASLIPPTPSSEGANP